MMVLFPSDQNVPFLIRKDSESSLRMSSTCHYIIIYYPTRLGLFCFLLAASVGLLYVRQCQCQR